MTLWIMSVALEPLLSSEMMTVKCCPLPHTMRLTLLDPLQQRCCNNVLRGGETREQGVSVDVTQFGEVQLECSLQNGVLQNNNVPVARWEGSSMHTRLPFDECDNGRCDCLFQSGFWEAGVYSPEWHNWEWEELKCTYLSFWISQMIREKEWVRMMSDWDSQGCWWYNVIEETMDMSNR